MKVKVVRVIARLNTGGPAIHTILLSRELNPERFTSLLVTGVVHDSEGDMGYYAQQVGVTPIVIPDFGRHVSLWQLVRAFFRLWRLIRQECPDVIHTHTATAGGLGRVAGVLYNATAWMRGRRRARLVHTFHGHVFHGYFSSFRSRLMVLAERALARVTDRVIAVSETVASDLVERYRVAPRDQVTVVPLGLDFSWVNDLADHTGVIRTAHAIPCGAVTVGLVGRLTRVKNHALLLAALTLVDRHDLRALLMGDGELQPELQRAIQEAGLSGRAFLTGWQREQARIYADLDIVCLTSRNEGTPVALIEAMAAGKPFISTRVGGVEDLAVGDAVMHEQGFAIYANGILVPSDDPRVLAAALTYLADHPGRRAAMGAVGQASVLKRFSKERLAHDIEEIYEALIGRGEAGCGR